MRHLRGLLAIALALAGAAPVAAEGLLGGLRTVLGEERPAPPAPPPVELLPPAAGGPVEIDLERAVAGALAANPGLKAVEEQRAEVTAGIREAVAAALPELAVVSSWSRSRNPSLLNSRDFEEILRQFPGGAFVPGEQELYRLALEVRQALYTSGKTGAAIELARVVGEVVEARVAAARLETALAAAEGYYRLLAARRSLAAVESQQRAREGALEVVEARFELGDATLLERLRSRAAVAEVAPEIARLEGAVEVAEQALRAVLGLAPGTVLAVAEAPATPPPPAPAVAELLAAALAARPELADLALQREALDRQQAMARAEGRPQLDLVGRYGREARLPEDLADDLFQDWAVTLALRWELFDGGERRGRVARLESQRRQLAWQRRQRAQEIALDIERAASGYQAARERWRAAEASADAAREASRVAAETYREGVSLQADLLDAQQREIAAELAQVEAHYDALTEAARLTRAVGNVPGEGFTAPTEEQR